MAGKNIFIVFLLDWSKCVSILYLNLFVSEFPVIKYNNTRISSNKQHPYIYAWLDLIFNIEKKFVQRFEIK
jgi:hypothetical protein